MGDILLEEMSPLGNIAAVVEDDGRTVYFYLYVRDNDEQGKWNVRACWVRNRQPAPSDADVEAMKEGKPPLLPAAFCAHPEGGPALDANVLRVVWFEECDAAALLEHDEILAIIPGWSGQGGFDGYARDCLGQGHYAWELRAANALYERTTRAEAFWQLWDDADYWQRWRDKRITALEKEFGPHAKYYAIDGGEFPPRAMLRFDRPDCFLFVTVGVSLVCQPTVEQFFDDPSSRRRIELAAAVQRNCPQPELTLLGQYLSAQARYPWLRLSWLGDGHTMPCDSTPLSCGGNRFPAVLLTTHFEGVPNVEMPSYRGDTVQVLWVYPITDSERAWAMEHDTSGLIERLAAAGNDFIIRDRASVIGPA